MSFLDDPPRQVVPRWRTFVQALRLGELAPLGARPRALSSPSLEVLQDAWADARTIGAASDFVASAFTLGVDAIANEAALFLVATPGAPNAARRIARAYLKHPSVSEESPNEESVNAKILLPSDTVHIAGIRRLRRRLVSTPRDPLRWTTLALHYTALGSLKKALRSIEVAVQLAPNNRHVIRSASRYFLHVGDGQRAHDVLVRSGQVGTDPWVLASEIAISDALHRKSRSLKRAAWLLETERFSPFEASEIASALGTIEYKHGNARKGRKLIAQSLVQPSDNVVAQAAWISRQMGAVVMARTSVQSHEASTWKFYERGQWSDAVDEARRWQGEESFSSRPAITGSFLASTALWEFGLARTIAEAGLRSNPNDAALLNNVAFAAAMGGDLSRAGEALRDAWTGDATEAQRITLYATSGLLAFRSGQANVGRGHYAKAIELARVLGDRDREARAIAHLAVEEARVGSPGARDLCAQAKKLVEKECGPLASLVCRFVDHGLLQPLCDSPAKS